MSEKSSSANDANTSAEQPQARTDWEGLGRLDDETRAEHGRRLAGKALEAVGRVGFGAVSVSVEAALLTKEAAGKAGNWMKNKSSELFTKGREGMIQAKGRAEARKAERAENRANRRAERAEAKETRQANLDVLDKQDGTQENANRRAEMVVQKANEIIEKTNAEIEAADKERAEHEKKLVELKVELINRENEKIAIQNELDADPNNNELMYKLQLAIVEENAAKGRVEATGMAKSRTDESLLKLNSKLERAESSAESAKERIASRAEAAKNRKAERRQMKKEARGDRFRDAGSRLGQGAKKVLGGIGRGLGKFARGAAKGVVAGVKGFREGWNGTQPAGATEPGPGPAPTRDQFEAAA